MSLVRIPAHIKQEIYKVLMVSNRTEPQDTQSGLEHCQGSYVSLASDSSPISAAFFPFTAGQLSPHESIFTIHYIFTSYGFYASDKKQFSEKQGKRKVAETYVQYSFQSQFLHSLKKMYFFIL